MLPNLYNPSPRLQLEAHLSNVIYDFGQFLEFLYIALETLRVTLRCANGIVNHAFHFNYIANELLYSLLIRVIFFFKIFHFLGLLFLLIDVLLKHNGEVIRHLVPSFFSDTDAIS